MSGSPSFSTQDYLSYPPYLRNNAWIFTRRNEITARKDVRHLHERKFVIEKGTYNTSPSVTHGSTLFENFQILIALISTTSISKVNASNKLTFLFTLNPSLYLIDPLTSKTSRRMLPQKNFITKKTSLPFFVLLYGTWIYWSKNRPFLYRGCNMTAGSSWPSRYRKD